MFFNFVAEHLDCLAINELRDVHGSDSSNEGFYE